MMKKISILTLTLLLCAFAQKSLATVNISNAIGDFCPTTTAKTFTSCIR